MEFFLKGVNIISRAKYIICTRSKSQHRKAIEVCHQCEHRTDCDEYQEALGSAVEYQEVQRLEAEHQESQQPESIQALNTLLKSIEKRKLQSEDIIFLKKELQELASLLPK